MDLVHMEEQLIRKTEELRHAMDGAYALDRMLSEARAKIASLELRLRRSEQLLQAGNGFCRACSKPTTGFLS